jgi:RNA polymerase subunit RPABC4/transcription elongation factor Spt4
MFFLIGGLTPREVVLDERPRLCPVCGLVQARYRRTDQWVHLFFIPVLRVKKGEPFLMCDRCERAVSEMGPEYAEAVEKAGEDRCGRCGKALRPAFRYCPHCGTPVSR